MKFKDKLILAFLSIITLGIYPLVVFKGNKTKEISNELSRKENKIINIEELKIKLGGIENIIGAEFTHTKVNIQIKDKKLVQVEAIKVMKGVEGMFVTSKNVSIIVGNIAKSIAQQLVED